MNKRDIYNVLSFFKLATCNCTRHSLNSSSVKRSFQVTLNFHASLKLSYNNRIRALIRKHLSTQFPFSTYPFSYTFDHYYSTNFVLFHVQSKRSFTGRNKAQGEKLCKESRRGRSAISEPNLKLAISGGSTPVVPLLTINILSRDALHV